MQKNKNMSNLTKKYYKKINDLIEYRNIIKDFEPNLSDLELNKQVYEFAKLLNGGVKYEKI